MNLIELVHQGNTLYYSLFTNFLLISNNIHPSNPRCRCHVGSGVGFCDNQNGLLQLHSGSTSSVVNRSTATGPECSRQTHQKVKSKSKVYYLIPRKYSTF